MISKIVIWGVFSPSPLPWVLLGAMLSVYLARQARQGCFSTPGWRKFYRVPLILGIIHFGVITGITAGLFMRIREVSLQSR